MKEMYIFDLIGIAEVMGDSIQFSSQLSASFWESVSHLQERQMYSFPNSLSVQFQPFNSVVGRRPSPLSFTGLRFVRHSASVLQNYS